MNPSEKSHNTIDLSLKQLVIIGVATSIITMVLYFLLPAWAFLGLLVGVSASVNILCGIFAALHFIRPSNKINAKTSTKNL